MTYATPEDVTSRWIGPNFPDSDELIQKYLDDAELMIRYEFPDLDTRVNTDAYLASRVRLVEVRMVTRALKNPELVRQVQSTTGPFSEGKTYGAETLAGLVFTAEDSAFLSAAEASSKQRATGVDLTPTTAYGYPMLVPFVIVGTDTLLPEE